MNQTETKIPLAAPRADVAAFERLTQALVGITVQSLDVLDSSVTVPQFRLLRTLDGLGTVSCTALATALGTAASSVTRMVDKLEGPGYVARGTDPHSRSIVTVEVTRTGREIVTAVLERRHRLIEAVLDEMSPADRDCAAAAAGGFVRLAGEAIAAGAKGPVAL